MASPKEVIQQQTNSLVDEGFKHLHARQFQEALDVARKLEDLQCFAGFELAALAHKGMGDREKAVRVLQRGVKEASEVWSDWQLLGNSFSDLDCADEAEAAYERALQCKDPWADSIHLNKAVLASRQERFDEALELLARIADCELRFHATEHRINILRRLDRTDEAATIAEAILAEDHGKEGDTESLARTAAMLGRIHLQQGRDRTQLRTRILTWMDQYRRDCAPLMAVLRDVDGLWSDRARSFKLTVNISFPDDHLLRAESAGFCVVCDVVADDLDEALYFVRRLEADEMGETFAIDRHRESEADPKLLKGVYWRSGRVFYGDED